MKNTRGFIAEERPDLIEEWHPLDNIEITPFNVRAGSDKSIVWSCKECEHVWETQAKSRAIKNTGCPKCHERYNVSFPELAIYFYIKQLFTDAQLNAPIEEIGSYKSVDVFVPSLNLVIEYDGGHTHRERIEIDRDKSCLILERGHRLIRIRDNGLPPLNIKGVREYLYERTSNKTIGNMIKHLLSIINEQFTGFTNNIDGLITKINVDIDNIPILAQIPPILEKDNLLEKYPEIESIWTMEKITL